MKFFDKQKVCFQKWGISEYREHLEQIKTIRKTYKNFPYLYCYDEKEEVEYQNAYMSAGDSLDAFVAMYNDELVGISIGCPLMENVTICSDLVGSFSSKTSYYFGDIIIKKEFWGHGLAQELYQRHIDYVEENDFERILALLVERDSEDPRKPDNYQKSKLWQFNNFQATSFLITYPWKTFSLSGEPKTEEHELRAYERKM